MHSLEDNGTFIIIFKYLLSKGKSNSLYIFKAWKKKVKIQYFLRFTKILIYY